MSRPATRSVILAAVVMVLSLLPAASQTSLVTTGSVWKYFDQGFEPPGWRTLLFDDAGWPSGPGQLGFGDGDEATVVSRTNSAGVTNISFYFRHAFNVADPSAFGNLMVRLRRDDGVIVYLNEAEVFRNNMPGGPVDSSTTALTTVSDDGNGVFAGPVSPALLNIGDNQLAVEIHQSAIGSTDISFDLELLGNVTFQPPTVNLLSPMRGATVGATSLKLLASAGDADGAITSVEFFDGSTWLGTTTAPTNSAYAFLWTGVSPGPHVVTAVAVDSTGLSATSAPTQLNFLLALINRGSAWKYLDDGSDPGTAWREPVFDDSGWSNGLAQLGYGDGDETTTLRRTDAAGNTNLTFYFRHAFEVANPSNASNLVVRLQRDDGAIVYLNGVEILRNNMPTGAVTIATTAVSALDDDLFHGAQVDPGLLVAGTNILAVEVHQAGATSSDVSFDLELLENVMPTAPAVSLTAPANNSTFLGPLNLVLTAFTTDVDTPVASVTFLNGSNTLGTVGVDITGNAVDGYLFAPGQHTLVAVATDSIGLSTTSAPVNITVIPAPLTATLIATGSVWRFYDTNSAPAASWRVADFDDSGWRSGPGILGYGGLGPANLTAATLINSGPPNTRHITAYFRHSFNVTNAADVTNLAFRLVRDDGAVLYLNGNEIFRMHMPTGAVTYATRAMSPGVSGTNELFYFPTNIVPAAGLLMEGPNLLAVELHQEAPTTSDAAFDLSLIAFSPPTPRPRLQIQFDGANVHLSWNDVPGFVLQEASAPQGPYTPNTNAPNPYVFSPSLPARFFRLEQP